MENFLSVLGHPERLKAAFAQLEITAKERKDLELLYSSVEAIEVSRKEKRRAYGPTISSCSKVGEKLSIALTGVAVPDYMMWIGEIKKRADGTQRWHMHPEIRSALKGLGWFQVDPPTEKFQEQADAAPSEPQRSRLERLARLAKAPRLPQRIEVVTTQFIRSKDVVDEVLFRAKGHCELCSKPAPFISANDGTPYLEVHHAVRLADGGEDTVENAVALCPNCHRELHFG